VAIYGVRGEELLDGTWIHQIDIKTFVSCSLRGGHDLSETSGQSEEVGIRRTGLLEDTQSKGDQSSAATGGGRDEERRAVEFDTKGRDEAWLETF
jgi:hypothetical protein